jgi:hypothetical protein
MAVYRGSVDRFPQSVLSNESDLCGVLPSLTVDTFYEANAMVKKACMLHFVQQQEALV